MRKIILAVVAFLCINALNAQTVKYHKVLMQGDGDLARTLLQLGITIDHSDVQEDGIAAEISDYELQTLKTNGIKYKILIYDMARFYEARNKADFGQRTMASTVCNAQNIVKPSHFHLGAGFGGYFNWNEMKQILDSMTLLYPNLITAKLPLSQQSIEGRDLYWVKISDNPNTNEAEPQVLYTALHHAREPASLSQLIFYMWYLLENYATNPDVQATVDNAELYFVPCVNPDGYVYNQSTNPNGGGMWRKNRRHNSDNTYGVDINRNYGFNWGFDNVGSSPTTSSDTYRGTSGFSEPETQSMRDFCNAHQFVTALNAHTYSNDLIYPWGYLPSIYTPDSATFVNWCTLLTQDSHYIYGTGDQTVNYTTNGDSDDWMYGEQTTKSKILSMTPEAGSAADGFWPASSRIIDICKTTFTQNYNLAKLVAKYAIARDDRDKFLSGNGYLNYKIQRLGMQPGTFTVSIVPVGTDISSVGAPQVYSSLTLNQTLSDSISFTLNTGLTPGQQVKYAIGVNNGSFTRLDTVTKIYGTPTTLLYDNGSSTATNYTTSGSWGLSTTKFVSPPNSITDSPTGNYTGNQNKSITTLNPMVLTNAVYAHLQYFTKFELEKDGDKAQILITTNNGTTWTPLCAKYTTSPASTGGTVLLYDGIQGDFVREDIDLSLYLGQTIKLRFLFTSDPSVNKDGFYFDDLLVRIIPSTVTGIAQSVLVKENIVLSPNPSNGNFNLLNPDGVEMNVAVHNSLGQLVYEKQNISALHSDINLQDQPTGIYFVKIKSGGEEVVKKIVVEK